MGSSSSSSAACWVVVLLGLETMTQLSSSSAGAHSGYGSHSKLGGMQQQELAGAAGSRGASSLHCAGAAS